METKNAERHPAGGQENALPHKGWRTTVYNWESRDEQLVLPAGDLAGVGRKRDLINTLAVTDDNTTGIVIIFANDMTMTQTVVDPLALVVWIATAGDVADIDGRRIVEVDREPNVDEIIGVTDCQPIVLRVPSRERCVLVGRLKVLR